MLLSVQRKSIWNALTIAALLFSFTATLAAADPAITPGTVEELIYPSKSLDVNKTVTTPEILPKPDIYFLADSTGSMGPAIANVQANAATILAAVAAATNNPQFGAGNYRDFPYDPFAFQNNASIDGQTPTLNAIAGWATGYGGDGPEAQLYALDQIASSVVGWRTDSTKIVVWFGDWPGHDPVCAAISGLGYNITEASVTAKLVAAEIRVIAISVTTNYGHYDPGCTLCDLDGNPTLMDGDYSGPCGTIDGTAGQATRIAAATGGVHFSNVAPEDVSDAILAGLTALPVEVSMASDCAAPVSTSFAPSSQTVTSGNDAVFVETISVVAGAAGGTYACKDRALINGQPMTDASGATIYENKTIHVPGIDLQPATDTNELGFVLSHTVVATVAAGSHGPVPGVRVEFEITAGPHAGATGVGVTDALGEADFTYTPLVVPASLGTDTIRACFTNPADTVVYGCDTAKKTWQDTTPPTSACVPTVNPAGKTAPNAPGKGGQGQNQDGFYQISGHDIVWPEEDLQVFVKDTGSGTVFGPFDVFTRIKYTEAPGGTPGIKPIGGPHSAVAWHIIGTGDAVVTVVDGSGNVSAGAACLVPPPPK